MPRIKKVVAKPFSKDIALKTLDTINMWINNCDTKASVILGIISIMITIIFSSDTFGLIKNIVVDMFANLKGCNWIFACVFLGSIVCMVTGFGFLISVIFPQIIKTPQDKHKKLTNKKTQYGDLMSYGLISQNTFDEYLAEVSPYCATLDKVMEDILFQIHCAACICNVKFEKFKKGILFFFIGIVNFSVQLVFGYCFYCCG